MRTFVCKQCGQEKENHASRGPNRVFCDECRKAKALDRINRYRAAHPKTVNNDLPELPVIENQQ